MTGKRSIIELISIIFTCCSLVFFSSCDNGSKEGIILFTEVAEDVQNINYETGNSWRYFPNSRIVAYDPNKSEREIMEDRGFLKIYDCGTYKFEKWY